MKEFVKAFLKAQSQMHHAKLDSKNPAWKSEYASLESVLDAIKPALNSNGLILIEKVCSLNDKLFVNTQIIHESGEMIESMTPIISERAGPQAMGSGISYARRYGLEALCAIGSKDDDGNEAESNETESEPDAKQANKPENKTAPPKPKGSKTAGPKFVISFGPDKGKTFEEVGVSGISSKVAQLKFSKADFAKTKIAKDFIEAATNWLKTSQNDLDKTLGENKPSKEDTAPPNDWANEPMPEF